MLVNLQFALGQNNRTKDSVLVSDLLESIVTA